ncbi:unnamed protein product [Prunus armeniaca]|uniref:Uncharacterized protein n=1 Tax=Prunus armeniaca TaxID=36596 RepID=A0A6J5XRZ6_PRUAR|nr:unnamed protein product [Prunus armeniaca]
MKKDFVGGGLVDSHMGEMGVLRHFFRGARQWCGGCWWGGAIGGPRRGRGLREISTWRWWIVAWEWEMGVSAREKLFL